VIGTSFLWRFLYHRDDTKSRFTLAPRPRRSY
jgi:hypothetical protein